MRIQWCAYQPWVTYYMKRSMPHVYIWGWCVALAAVAKPEQAALVLRSQLARHTHPRHKPFDARADFNTLCIAPLAQASALGLATP